MQNTDFVVWLSNWMWVAKEHGYERAKKTDHLFFDTAQGGSDPIDSFQLEGAPAVYKLLKENTKLIIQSNYPK